MVRILGAVAAVIALVAIAFLWQPWKSRQGTAQLPLSREQPAPQPTTPLVSLDEMQSRMADDELVRRAVARAMDALASSEKEPDFVDKDCESDAKAKDVSRGMMLSVAGYLLVMTDLRSGDYENYGFVPEDRAHIDTAPLLAHWTKDRVSAFWQGSNALASLPAEDKRAVAAFLNELKSFRPIYVVVKRTAPDYDNFPIETLNEVLQKAGRPQVNKCLLGYNDYVLKWNVHGNGTEISMLPASYMLDFWNRRAAQGTTDLAEWFLTAMSGWLSRS
jgi:hypothetical protein